MVLIPEVALFALMFFTLALALCAKQIAEALKSAMSAVPIIGSAIAAILSPIPHALSWVAGKLEHGIDALAGATWHSLSAMTRQFWHNLTHTAQIVAHMAAIVGNFAYSQSGLKAIVHRLEKVFHGIEHGVKQLVKEWHGIERRVKHLEHAIAHGIGHDLRLHIKALERTLHGVTTKTIPGLREVDRYLDRRVSDLYGWLKGEVSIPGLGTLAAAIGAVLATLGLDWLGCRDGAKRVGRSGCGLWDDLGDVFGLLAAVAVAVEFEQFVHDAQAATEATIGAVKDVSGLG